MVARFVGVLVIGICLISGIALAELTPDNIVISNSKLNTGLIANGHDQAVISVTIYDGDVPVNDTQVIFAVLNPSFGTIDPVLATTDINGQCSATFTAGTQAGNAEVRATVNGIANTTSLHIFAPIPDESSYIISSADVTSEGWLVANGTDSATISVHAFNSSPSYTNYPLRGLQVQFKVNNSIFGSFTPVSSFTNGEGIAQSTFKTATKSGTALLYGNISYLFEGATFSFPLSLQQKIDHDTPYRITEYNYTYRVEVGETTPLVFSFSDRWGNLVDNRRIAEEVNFTVSSPSDLPKGAGFVDGFDHFRFKMVPVDSNGFVRAELKVDEVPGWNYVNIHPLMYDLAGEQAFDDKSLVIEGIPGKPVRIAADFTPSDFRVPADGISVFDITYTLWDKYNNYVQNRSVMVETNIPGEEKVVGTNPQGQAVLRYGPKFSIGLVVITATAVDNTSVTHSQQVWFVPLEPADVLFTVSPQTMPSLDVPNRGNTWLIATVVDESGNPVNETVQVVFGIDQDSITYDEDTYDIIADPDIPVTTATTDEYGIAMVEFLPGGFDPTNTTPATGRCNVTATWGGITRTIPVVWKNYPYLSVEAYASTNLVEVNDTVDIDVLLKGDGYKLQPPPIDVILCIDRSGSMLYDNPDRMYSVREAAKIFADQLSPSRDRIALVTFGAEAYSSRPGYLSGLSTSYINNVYNPWSRDYSGYATTDKALTSDFNGVKIELDRIHPDHGTPMREALRLSISNLLVSGRSDAVKAVVILSDGDYNWYGDPLARGTGSTYSATSYGDLTLNYRTFSDLGSGQYSNQNMSVYANSSNIKIYSIAYADSISSGGRTTLETLALGSQGKYYAASATDIADVYAAIAGDLKTDAGVNTEMDLDYKNIIVNYSTTEINDPSNPIFDYVYSYGNSTYINSYFTDGSEINIPGLPWNFNNTSQWAETKKLEFSLGTVRLYQVWEIKYRLKAQKEGLFNLFGPDSQITFQDADEPLLLPDLVLKVNPEISDTPINNTELFYTQIEQNTSGDNPDIYITFDLSHVYNGDQNVREDYYIVTYDGRRYYLGSTILTPEEANTLRQYVILTSKLPVGWERLEPILTEIGWRAPGPIIPSAPIPIVQGAGDPNREYIILT